MAKKFDALTDNHISFIEKQKMFFTGSAATNGRVNISPKGMNTFRCLSQTTVAYLDHTGSGNETMAHLQINPRMTFMFCSFEKEPLILRIYGIARSIQPHEPEWQDYIHHFDEMKGQRQIIVCELDLVLTSCGFGVPLYDFISERDILRQWSDMKGDEGLAAYRLEKNAVSIDGFPTNVIGPHS